MRRLRVALMMSGLRRSSAVMLQMNLRLGAEDVPGWTVPWFVDTHVHGGGGADYASTDPDEVLRAREFHRRHGTTSTFASLARSL